ncbi:MAG TPA: acyl carrier protein [Gemmatales bacterium]|nr:acyl carrier protein [Gemmatales bacterium]HMP59180.1 acyl carrier protein [Gemmatales bacterium]
MTATKEQVFEKVSATLADSLNVEPEEIKLESTLQGDLGAESIDFLDIVFRLERGFGIKIPRDELFPESIFQGDPEFVKDGLVTTAGIEELRQRLPFADIDSFAQDPQYKRLGDLFTVAMITNYVQSKLAK